jgi:crotonobetainyl-CoA:carnitine CoA-transferase CaiB-like acyl-CoA transferase
VNDTRGLARRITGCDDALSGRPPLMASSSARPLDGVRVLELGQLLAGPFASVLLAWFGADVIKVEPPDGGDPLRTWRQMHHGTSLWWYSLARNKRCVTANLREREGRELVKRLVTRCDVVIENFRPGRMEEWGLGFDDLKAVNPRILMARVSGYGQTGPYAPKPGYASVAEGYAGLRYVTGFPDRPPARSNLSLGDSIAGLHAALGILTALYHRDAKGAGEGQVIDVAIYESVLNLMESVVPEFATYGIVRERHGSKVTGIVPSNSYPCADGKFIIIGGNGDSIFKRLMVAAGRPDLAEDPRVARNDGRVRHEEEIDAAITEWTRRHPFDVILAALDAADVPAGPIYSVADQMVDPHFHARGLFEEVTLPDGERVTVTSFAPQLSQTPGETRWPGPPLGAHNHDVYGGLLGLSDEQLADLKKRGVI